MLQLSGGIYTQTAQRVKQPGLAEQSGRKFSSRWEILIYTETEDENKKGWAFFITVAR